jgi:hypothetical protein
VACGVLADAPAHCLAARAWTGGDTLTSHCPPGGYDPSLSSVKIADQDVEMHPGSGAAAIPGPLEGKPLAMGRGFQGHPARIPLHRRPAEQTGPE